MRHVVHMIENLLRFGSDVFRRANVFVAQVSHKKSPPLLLYQINDKEGRASPPKSCADEML